MIKHRARDAVLFLTTLAVVLAGCTGQPQASNTIPTWASTVSQFPVVISPTASFRAPTTCGEFLALSDKDRQIEPIGGMYVIYTDGWARAMKEHEVYEYACNHNTAASVTLASILAEYKQHKAPCADFLKLPQAVQQSWIDALYAMTKTAEKAQANLQAFVAACTASPSSSLADVQAVAPAAPTTTAPAAPAPGALSIQTTLSLTSQAGYSMTLNFAWDGLVASDVGNNPPGLVTVKVSQRTFTATLTNTTVGGRTIPIGALREWQALGGLYPESGPVCTGLKNTSQWVVQEIGYCFVMYEYLLSTPSSGALAQYQNIPNNTPLSYGSANLGTTAAFGTGASFPKVSEAGAPALLAAMTKPLALAVSSGSWKPAGAACTKPGQTSSQVYYALLNGATTASVPGCLR